MNRSKLMSHVERFGLAVALIVSACALQRHQALIITYHRFSELEGGARISARAFCRTSEVPGGALRARPAFTVGGLFAKA